MGAARKDASGILDAELKGNRSRKTAVLDKVSCLSPKGITFTTDTYLPEWTEVGVEIRLPKPGARLDPPIQIDCRGVVVQCAQREKVQWFEVVLLFLDLPQWAKAHLDVAPSVLTPLSISISR
jgi:hypothetical protein